MRAQSLWPTKPSEDSYHFINYNIESGLSNNSILDIFQDSNGFIWIATEDGLNRFDGYEFLCFKNNSKDFTTISADFITDIDEDESGNLWIGTINGLNKYDKSKNLFIKYFHNPGNVNSLSSNYVRAIHCKDDSLVWIETIDGVLNKLNVKTQRFYHFQHSATHQSYYNYHTIYQYDNKRLWIGTRNLMPQYFDLSTKKFKQFEVSKNDSLKKREGDVSFYHRDTKNRFWIVGIDGAYIMDSIENFHRKIRTATFSIIEDKNNNLWFGTANGLYVKSTNSDTVIFMKHDKKYKNSLIADYINCMMMDKDNNLWIGTGKGISLYKTDEGLVKHYEHKLYNSNSISGNEITSVVEDTSSQSLWIGTEQNGLNLVDLNDMNAKKIGLNVPIKKASDHISSLILDEQRNLWIGLWSGIGFAKLNLKNGEKASYTINKLSTYEDWYSDFEVVGRNHLYIALWGGNGLVLFDKMKDTFANPPLLPDIVLYNDSINNLIKIDKNHLWFLNSKNQLVSYNSSTFKLEKLISFHNINKDYKKSVLLRDNSYLVKDLPNFNKIYKISEGFDQNIFLLTNMGVYSYSTNDDLFVQISKIAYEHIAVDSIKKRIWCYGKNGYSGFDFSFKNPIPIKLKILNSLEKIANSKIISFNNTLFIANNKLLTKLIIKEDENISKTEYILPDAISNILFQNGTLYINCLSTIYILKNKVPEKIYYGKTNHPIMANGISNSIFIGDGNRLLKYDKEKNTVSKYDFNYSYYSFKKDNIEIFSIKTFDDYNIYLGTSKGLLNFNIQHLILSPIRYNESGYCKLGLHLATSVTKTNDSTLWIGTTNESLKRYNIKANKLYSYETDILDSNSFWGKSVTTGFVDKKRNLWIGGYGLNKYISKEDIFQHFTTDNGLPDNTILGITQDKHGNLWIATKKGLVVFNQDFQSFKNINIRPKNPQPELTSAIRYLSNNRLFIGSKSGYYILNPDSLWKNNSASNIQITAIYINDVISSYYPDCQNNNELNYSQNTVTFEFANLQFHNSTSIIYYYRLKGYDNKWVQVNSNQRKVRYSKLPAGKFVFEIRTDKNLKVASPTLKYNFSIATPYWQEWWFYVFLLLSFSAPIAIFLYLRWQKVQEAKRSLLLEQQLLRSQMNPHFIFNSLNSIQSYILDKDPLQAASYLSKFSKLVRLILNHSQEELITIEREIETLKNYLELQKIRFEDKFNYQINIDPQLNIQNLHLPPLLTQPFIENSIEHGFKNIDYKGFIKISINQIDNKIVIRIEDNGKGIDIAMKEKIDNKAHKSLATIIAKNRIANIGKSYKGDFGIEIIDLSGESSEQHGTQVNISLPIIY